MSLLSYMPPVATYVVQLIDGSRRDVRTESAWAMGLLVATADDRDVARPLDVHLLREVLGVAEGIEV